MSTPSPAPAAPVAPPRRRVATGVVAGLVLAAAVVAGLRHWRFAQSHEETDDAQVEGDISPVLPRVAGYVARVDVRDNQRVAVGQALIGIDPAELELRLVSAAAALDSAQAELKTAEAGLANARASEAVARAEAVVARVQRDKAAADLERDRKLFDGSAITDRQLKDSRAAAETAAAQELAARRRSEAANVQVLAAEARIVAARAGVEGRRAEADYARLQRSYAEVAAPIAGLVSHKSVEPGQFVQAGQTLLYVASDANPWVVANFKETQLKRMQVGQEATFTADAYPGVVFRGRVDSIAGATGARFALLPPDNASGNFVKVTQRVPVKIVLTGPADPRHALRPGMSVDAIVGLE